MPQTGAAAFGNAGVAWLTDTIKAILADASFTPTYDAAGNVNNASFLSDVSSSQVGPAVALTGKTNVAGLLGATSVLFGSVTGNTVVRVWIYKDTGTAATSQLLFMSDTFSSGAPLVPGGGPVTLNFDPGTFTGVAGVAII